MKSITGILFSLMSAALLLMIACQENSTPVPTASDNTADNSKGTRAQLMATTSCNASSTLGSKCSVNCSGNTVAKCEGGLFTPECWCETVPPPIPVHERDKPFLDGDILELAGDFVDWTDAYGTTNMSDLSDKAADVIDAYRNGTDADYSAAESAYHTAYENLTSAEMTAVVNWVDGAIGG